MTPKRTTNNTTTTPTRTGLYLRISADRTGEGAGVERQEKQARLMARSKGWQVTDVYSDNDVSATSNRKRPEFERMIRDVETGRLDAILVWHLDRLARKMSDLTRIIEVGGPYRLIIQAVNGTSLDLSDPTGIAVAQILVAIAGMEVAHKANRQRAANLQRAEQGRPNKANRAFGFNPDGTVRAEEARYVRAIFKRFVSGEPIIELARWMTAEGQQAASGRARADGRWSRTGIRIVLQNRLYVGDIVYRGDVVATGRATIVDAGTFAAAQSKLADPTRTTTTGPSRKWLGSNVYRCGVCGGPMVSHSSSVGRSYRCPGHITRLAAAIDETVKNAVTQRLSLPVVRRRLLGDKHDGVTATLRDEKNALIIKRDGLGIELTDGNLTAVQVKLATAKLDERIGHIQAELTKLGQRSAMADVQGAADPGLKWLELDVWRQAEVLTEMCEVTVLTAKSGQAFTANSVRIGWK